MINTFIGNVLWSWYLYLWKRLTRVSFNFSANCLKYYNLRYKLRIVNYVNILEHFVFNVVSMSSFWDKCGKRKGSSLRKWSKKVQLSKIAGKTLYNHLPENYRVSLSFVKKCFTQSVSPTSFWSYINSSTAAMWSRMEVIMV